MAISKINIFSWTFSLILSLVTVGSILVIYGFFWEDWQGFTVLVGYGLISTPPSFDMLFQDVLFFQLPFLIHLSTLLQSVPVFGIWIFFIIVLYVSLWFHLGIRILGRITGQHLGFTLLCSHLFVWGIIAISLVYVNVTRDSMLLLSGSVLLYLDYYLYDGRISYRLLFLSILGISMRVFSGVIALGAMTILFTLLFRDFRKVFHLLKIHWAVALICLAIVHGFYPNANVYEAKLESYEYPIMGAAMVPLSEMHSRYDTVRYEALRDHFQVTDTAKISLSFINRVVDLRKYRNPGLNKAGIDHLGNALLPLLDDSEAFILLFYTLLLIICWGRAKRAIVNVILFNLSCWTVIVLLAMKVTMQSHFYMPWVSMTFSGSLLLSQSQRLPLRPGQQIAAVVLLITISVVVFLKLNEYSKEEKESNLRGYTYLQKLNPLSKKKTLIIWDNYPQFPNNILARKELSALRECIYLSAYPIQFYDFGQERCKRKLGFSPLDWRAMNISLHDKSDEIRFITEDTSALYLEAYYRAVYNLDFKLIKDTPGIEIARDLYVFHLSNEKKQ